MDESAKSQCLNVKISLLSLFPLDLNCGYLEFQLLQFRIFMVKPEKAKT